MIKALVIVFFMCIFAPVRAAEYSVVRQYVHPILIAQPSPTDPSIQMIIGSGSVVIVASGYAITAAHVVPETPKESLFVIFNNRRYKATPIKIDREKDLALLSVDVSCPCATLATTLPLIDDVIVSTGYPLFTTYRIQLLTIGNVQGMYLNNLVTTTHTAPGGSGGGIFYKEKTGYNLAGITVAIGSNQVGPRVMQIEQEYNWLSFSVPAVDIRTFLRNTPADVKKAP